MNKILIIFFVGLIEQALYTAYLLSVTRKQKYVSSILMTLYMTLYLGIMAYAIKDADTIVLLLAYALACGIGNLLVMFYDGRRNCHVLPKPSSLSIKQEPDITIRLDNEN